MIRNYTFYKHQEPRQRWVDYINQRLVDIEKDTARMAVESDSLRWLRGMLSVCPTCGGTGQQRIIEDVDQSRYVKCGACGNEKREPSPPEILLKQQKLECG